MTLLLRPVVHRRFSTHDCRRATARASERRVSLLSPPAVAARRELRQFQLESDQIRRNEFRLILLCSRSRFLTCNVPKISAALEPQLVGSRRNVFGVAGLTSSAE